jgi:hypothetical protein
MLCENYQQLSKLEQRVIIGELLHAFQSDDTIFDKCCEVLNLAKKQGILDNVTIYPEVQNL